MTTITNARLVPAPFSALSLNHRLGTRQVGRNSGNPVYAPLSTPGPAAFAPTRRAPWKTGGFQTITSPLQFTNPLAPTGSLVASSGSIALGASVTLTWASSGATSAVALGAWSGTRAVNGSTTVTPGAPGTYNYSLVLVNASGSTYLSAQVVVANPPPVPSVELVIVPASIYLHQSSYLVWSVANATSITASGDWSGPLAASGEEQFQPTAARTYTFTITANGPGGTTTVTQTLIVTALVSKVRGSTVKNGSPVQRRVVVMDASTGDVLGTAISASGDGSYEVDLPTTSDVVVTGIPADNTEAPYAFRRTPEPL